MSKKNKSKRDECCCYEPVECCCNQGTGFGGINSCVTPIIFLLIACSTGLLNNNCSWLIILLFLLCGDSFGNLFGGGQSCCC